MSKHRSHKHHHNEDGNENTNGIKGTGNAQSTGNANTNDMSQLFNNMDMNQLSSLFHL